MDLLSRGNEPEEKPAKNNPHREALRLPRCRHRLDMGLCIQPYCRYPALPGATSGITVYLTLRTAYERTELARAPGPILVP